MKHIILLLVLNLFITTGLYAEKPISKLEFRILFVGNSLTYYNNVSSMVSALILAANKEAKVEVGMIIQGGYSLAQHLSIPLVRNIDNKYDFVVIQDFGGWPFCSHTIPACSANNDALEEMVEIIRISAATPIWYSTYQANISVQKNMSLTVDNIAKQLNVKIADVGASLQKYITINNQDTVFSKDGHLSYSGSLVAATTITQSILGPISEGTRLNEICTENWRGTNIMANKLASNQVSKGITCKKTSSEQLKNAIIAGRKVENIKQ